MVYAVEAIDDNPYLSDPEYQKQVEEELSNVPFEKKLDLATQYLFFNNSYDDLSLQERGIYNHIFKNNNSVEHSAGEEVESTFKGIMHVAQEQGDRAATKFAAGIARPCTEMLYVLEHDISELYNAATDQEKTVMNKMSVHELYTYAMDHGIVTEKKGEENERQFIVSAIEGAGQDNFEYTHMREIMESEAPYKDIMTVAMPYMKDKHRSRSKAENTIHKMALRINEDKRTKQMTTSIGTMAAIFGGKAALDGGLEALSGVALNYGTYLLPLMIGKEVTRRVLDRGYQAIPYLEKADEKLFGEDNHYMSKGLENTLDGIESTNDFLRQYIGMDVATLGVYTGMGIGSMAMGTAAATAFMPLAVIGGFCATMAYIPKTIKGVKDGYTFLSEKYTKWNTKNHFLNEIEETFGKDTKNEIKSMYHDVLNGKIKLEDIHKFGKTTKFNEKDGMPIIIGHSDYAWAFKEADKFNLDYRSKKITPIQDGKTQNQEVSNYLNEIKNEFGAEIAQQVAQNYNKLLQGKITIQDIHNFSDDTRFNEKTGTIRRYGENDLKWALNIADQLNIHYSDKKMYAQSRGEGETVDLSENPSVEDLTSMVYLLEHNPNKENFTSMLYMLADKKIRDGRDNGGHLVDKVNLNQGWFENTWNKFKRSVELGFNLGNHYFSPFSFSFGRKTTKEDLKEMKNTIIKSVTEEFADREEFQFPEGHPDREKFSSRMEKEIGDYFDNIYLGDEKYQEIRGSTDSTLASLIRKRVAQRSLSSLNYNFTHAGVIDTTIEKIMPHFLKEGGGTAIVTSANDHRDVTITAIVPDVDDNIQNDALIRQKFDKIDLNNYENIENIKVIVPQKDGYIVKDFNYKTGQEKQVKKLENPDSIKLQQYLTKMARDSTVEMIIGQNPGKDLKNMVLYQPQEFNAKNQLAPGSAFDKVGLAYTDKENISVVELRDHNYFEKNGYVFLVPENEKRSAKELAQLYHLNTRNERKEKIPVKKVVVSDGEINLDKIAKSTSLPINDYDHINKVTTYHEVEVEHPQGGTIIQQQPEVLYKRGMGGGTISVLKQTASKGGIVQYPTFKIENGIFMPTGYDVREFVIGSTDKKRSKEIENILTHECEHITGEIEFFENYKSLAEREARKLVEQKVRAEWDQERQQQNDDEELSLDDYFASRDDEDQDKP